MKRLVPVLALVLMAGALPASADAGGGNCYTPRYESPFCYCIARYGTPGDCPEGITGYVSCEEHNPCLECMGPGWCETNGVCCLLPYLSDGHRAFGKEQDSIAILDFLVELGKMTESQRATFVAEVDEQVGDGLTECEIEARHDAYRAKFAELMGIALRPGFIPVAPSRTKQPPARIIASK